MTAEITVYFNARCSKARKLRDLLTEHGVEAEFRHYLDTAPTREELVGLLQRLGEEDPRAIMRSKEAAYQQLNLDSADRDQLLDAIQQHPILLERPILVRGEQAVVARPPEKALTLLGLA
ncbi:MAG: arsenate reductase (glutaredoxin) [Planctomycetota bacterium]|nr:MAG: arsenate reductase (glutaredoxin) [Planctomycetota bacterium]